MRERVASLSTRPGLLLKEAERSRAHTPEREGAAGARTVVEWVVRKGGGERSGTSAALDLPARRSGGLTSGPLP